MTTPTNKTHQKHIALARVNSGEFGRNELAILGTACVNIKQLAHAIIQQLSGFSIAYVDADHQGEEAGVQSASAISKGAYAEYTNKISFTRLDINSQPNRFRKQMLLNDSDLVLINGNHFTAAQQIIVIDDAKPLEKKLDRLTDVQLILWKNEPSPLPDYLLSHLPNIASIPTLSLNDTPGIIQFVQNYWQQRLPALNGLVLAGGKSTRMGTDKGLLTYHGTTQREHLVNLLSPFCKEVFVSGTAQQAAENVTQLPFVEDAFIGLGPVGGILSAFQQQPGKAWLTVACDLPLLDAATLSYLVDHRNPSKMATAFLSAEDQFPEPLITIWEPKAYPFLLQMLSLGYSCPRKALINGDTQLLHPPDASTLKNINTAEEYNEVIRLLNKKHNYC